jgi:hypothetical protein
MSLAFRFADGRRCPVLRRCHDIRLTLGGQDYVIDFLVAPITDVDMMLGYEWLRTANPIINWTTGKITSPAHGLIAQGNVLRGADAGLAAVDVETIATTTSAAPIPTSPATPSTPPSTAATVHVVDAKGFNRLLKKPGMLDVMGFLVPRERAADSLGGGKRRQTCPSPAWWMPSKIFLSSPRSCRQRGPTLTTGSC